jgi:nucleoside-diphosphate-sugar epimerase
MLKSSEFPSVLVTGATGFVGQALVAKLCELGVTKIVCASRTSQISESKNVSFFHCEEAIDKQDWHGSLEDVGAIFHLAARVHVTHDLDPDPALAFKRVNVSGSLNLARQAAAAGVKRFVFVSSIKVNGEATQLGHPFTADDTPAPLDAYGMSKMEAEQGLREIALQTGMEMVIIRPPLVYGPGVKANFAAMMSLLKRGLPLPLGAIHNKRSLVSLDNLVNLLVTCITHPAAANQTFLVSDGEDVSTTELLYRTSQALGRPARLLPLSASWVKLAAALVGKSDVADRLCQSLQVDIEKTQRLLGWTAPLTLDQGLKKTAAIQNSA